MSDIKKWMTLSESVYPIVTTPSIRHKLSRDTTVILGPQVGGGVGRFIEFTASGSALIDVKGIVKEFSNRDFSIPDRNIQTGNDWFHVSVAPDSPGKQNDKPEFSPGDTVKIADVYGAVIGPGFGVFVEYGTTGQDCIILFDGEKIIVPIKNVASVLEQNAKNNFDEMDNDGNLSPMSFGSDNIKIDQSRNSNQLDTETSMDNRDEFTKWIDAMEAEINYENNGLDENSPLHDTNCGCNSWNCDVCFPEQPNSLDTMQDNQPACDMEQDCRSQGFVVGQSDMEDADLKQFMDNMLCVMDKTAGTSQDTPMIDGDDLINIDLDADIMHDPDVFDDWVYEETNELADIEQNKTAADMKSTIKYMQSMGLSKADREYSAEELDSVEFSQLNQIYSQITGNINERGSMTMENVDKDIKDMLLTLKKYDKLAESAAPVLGMRTVNEVKGEKPEWLKTEEEKSEEKEADSDEKLSDKQDVKESSDVDPEIVSWMARFSKLSW